MNIKNLATGYPAPFSSHVLNLSANANSLLQIFATQKFCAEVTTPQKEADKFKKKTMRMLCSSGEKIKKMYTANPKQSQIP